MYKTLSESSSLIYFEWFVYQHAVAAGRRPVVALGPHTEHLCFSYMRGGGILERCHEATELKPLYLVHFSIFGLNVRLNDVKFCASFLKALVKDFGLKFSISNG